MAAVCRNLKAIKIHSEDELVLLSSILFYYEPSGPEPFKLMRDNVKACNEEESQLEPAKSV